MASIVQRPTPPNEWLHNGAKDHTRIFSDYIIRPDYTPAWKECTTEEKEQWKAEHQEHIAHNARVQEEQEKANFEQNL